MIRTTVRSGQNDIRTVSYQIDPHERSFAWKTLRSKFPAINRLHYFSTMQESCLHIALDLLARHYASILCANVFTSIVCALSWHTTC